MSNLKEKIKLYENELISGLYEDDYVSCPVLYQESGIGFIRHSKFYNKYHDFIISNTEEDIGYLCISHIGENKKGKHVFEIINPNFLSWPSIFHSGFSNSRAVGIEVKDEYRRKGYSEALLSIGVAYCQKLFSQSSSKKDFVVWSSPKKEAVRFFERFGFEKKGKVPNHFEYGSPNLVSEIKTNFSFVPK